MLKLLEKFFLAVCSLVIIGGATLYNFSTVRDQGYNHGYYDGQRGLPYRPMDRVKRDGRILRIDEAERLMSVRAVTRQLSEKREKREERGK